MDLLNNASIELSSEVVKELIKQAVQADTKRQVLDVQFMSEQQYVGYGQGERPETVFKGVKITFGQLFNNVHER